MSGRASACAQLSGNPADALSGYSQYEICVPEELYSSRIPKITLQPLVENALYHGIKNKRGKGMIRIDGEMEDSDCILRITDNGRA